MLLISVPTMACSGSANGVIRAIQSVDAAARIGVDLRSREVHIESLTANATELLAALRRAGYPAESGSHRSAEATFPLPSISGLDAPGRETT